MILPIVSVCIPAYYSGPAMPRVLDELLSSLAAQDYPQDRLHKCVSLQACAIDHFSEVLRVLTKYGCKAIFPRENVKGPAMNTNSAMSIAEGKYIKLMNQDDLIDRASAISEMVDILETAFKPRWLASACMHTDGVGIKRERLHVPSWPGEKAMVEGVNRIGCPSVVMFHRDLKLECDVNVLYAMDCDMWIQLQRQAGPPIVHQSPNIVVRMWESQLTENLNIPRQLELDKQAMRRKYGYT